MDLYIKSFEGNIYFAEQKQGSTKRIVRDSQNQPMRFDSISNVKEHFKDQSFENVWLEHDSAYDEMCGLGGKCGPMVMPLNWK
ncbi:DUF6482 family protein [Thalassotalea euphylliae]|uniref:DUF6482 family protein n=1 Tax=Thalassotalea euphylliae TaxID=1655234 RepID=UPI00362C8B4C